MGAGIIHIEVPGPPVPKGRPRLTTRGGFARAYTPAKTQRYEGLLRLEAAEVMDGRAPVEGPLSVTVAAYVSIPKGFPKAKRVAAESGALRPITRPDMDNYLKCLDGLNGIVWHDDSQIVRLLGVKFYSDRPRLSIVIEIAA